MSGRTITLVTAAAACCRQQEIFAICDHYAGTDPDGRRARIMAELDLRPWRQIMSPPTLHLIHVLEEMGAYTAPVSREGALI